VTLKFNLKSLERLNSYTVLRPPLKFKVYYSPTAHLCVLAKSHKRSNKCSYQDINADVKTTAAQSSTVFTIHSKTTASPQNED